METDPQKQGQVFMKRHVIRRTGWLTGLLAGAVALAGCTSPPTTWESSANLLGAMGDVPASFSDEGSMREVAESQELLSLQREEYQVGPDDVIEVSVFEWETNDQTKTLQLRVSETGVIAMPVVGPLNVAGKPVQKIQQMIERKLIDRSVLQTPRVGVWVSEFRSRQISVIGAVNQPGSYAIHQNVSTLLNMLTLAGGPQESAGAMAYITRAGELDKGQARIIVDLAELLETGDAAHNPVLSAGDVVYVPKAPLIYVYGAVRQAGAFTFRKQLRAMEAIALAGGFSELANRRAVSLTRRSASGEANLHQLDMAKIEQGQAPNLYLRDGDVLHIRTSGGKAFGQEVLAFIRGIFTFSYRIN